MTIAGVRFFFDHLWVAHTSSWLGDELIKAQGYLCFAFYL
jgi:hypothetical protein